MGHFCSHDNNLDKQVLNPERAAGYKHESVDHGHLAVVKMLK